MTDPLQARRKRIRYRAWHRGTKELDLLIGNFADGHLEDLNSRQLDRFEALLELPEPLLYSWLVGSDAPTADYDNDVTRLLLNFKLQPPAR